MGWVFALGAAFWLSGGYGRRALAAQLGTAKVPVAGRAANVPASIPSSALSGATGAVLDVGPIRLSLPLVDSPLLAADRNPAILAGPAAPAASGPSLLAATRPARESALHVQSAGTDVALSPAAAGVMASRAGASDDEDPADAERIGSRLSGLFDGSGPSSELASDVPALEPVISPARPERRGARLREPRPPTSFPKGGRDARPLGLPPQAAPRVRRLFQGADDPDAGIKRLLRHPVVAAGDAVKALLARLMSAPIHAGRYGSESGFLRLFEALAAKAPGGSEAGTSPPARLAMAVVAGYDMIKDPPPSFFSLNLAVLADDSYLGSQIVDFTSWQDSLVWARLRSRFGKESVKTLAELERTGDEPPPAPKKPGVAVRLGRAALRAVPGGVGRILRDLMEFVRPVDMGVLGFPSVSEKWARSGRHRRMLSLFYRRLERLEENLDLLHEPPSVWELALKVTAGDAMEACEMLGGIIGQTKRPLRFVERRVMPRFADAAGADAAFADAAKAYYLLGSLHERSVARFGRSPLYPEGAGVRGPKFWHFYAAAMTAGRMLALGHDPRLVRAAGVALAAAYEGFSLPANLRFSLSYAVKKGMPMVRDGIEDVAAQARGNLLALRGFRLAPARARRVGFLTGTFDPPHDGHLALARIGLDSGLDEVWLLPNIAAPHKPGASPFGVRHRMARALAANDLDVRVADIELLEEGGPSHDRLFDLFKERYPSPGEGAAFYRLIGEDSFNSMARDGGLDRESRRHKLLVFARPGVPAPAPALRGVDEAVAEGRVLIINTRLPFSSAEIREGSGSSRSPPEVREIYEEEKLYYPQSRRS